MTIEDYKKIINEVGFEEYPDYVASDQEALESFIDFKIATLDLKIYLTKLILCRCFPPGGGIYWPDNPNWFIRNFLTEYERHFPKPWLTNTVTEAIEMIISKETFTKEIIGTPFMFGIIEYYAKNWLGWEIDNYDFFDEISHQPFRTMSLSDALIKLRKSNTDLAKDLNAIDTFNIDRSKQRGTQERRWVKIRLVDRIVFTRNIMLHGQQHSLYDNFKYIVMIYILFHFHDRKRRILTDGNK